MSDKANQHDTNHDQSALHRNDPNDFSAVETRGNDTLLLDHGKWSFLSNFTCGQAYMGTVLIAMTCIGALLIGITATDETLNRRVLTKIQIVDVNGPPTFVFNGANSTTANVAPKKASKKKKKKKSNYAFSMSNYDDDDSQYHPLLVIDANDDQIPAGKAQDSIFGTIKTALHASDALECREAVINFVINATDGKDECNGLKRAFDKTCNSDAPEVDENKDKVTHSQVTEDQQFRRHRRRLMFDSSRPSVLHQKWKALVYATWGAIRRNIVRPLLPKSPLAIFSEDEVAGNAWKDAQYLVENHLDKIVHKDLSRRLKTKKKSTNVDTTAEQKEALRIEEQVEADFEDKEEDNESVKEQVDESNTESLNTKEPKTIAKVKQSLTLPTSNQHVSDTMLSETLLLQQEDTVQKAIDKVVNQTNVTMNEAAIDAAVSAKAVQEASAAVSAVLNDPTSVEARTCCASILNVFHENCDTPEEEIVSDKKLFLIVFVLALCGMVKSLIRHFQIRWLPEAAGCILVGVLCGAVISFVPHYDISFDGDWFLRIMVPPIVFEAALSINKRSFNRHIWPIMIYAVAGTLLATCITAFIVHQGTSMLPGCETIPYVESLTFGALISSIDPIAVLSVLSSMGMTDTDSIYVLIFGESLLNDGVSLVLFETLVHFLDESLVIDEEAVIGAAIHCLVVALGSLCVGVASGFTCAFYYWMMQGCQTPLVEVLLFFCWAFIPYYVCDGIGWSGIVAVVATGFVMDLFVVGQSDYSDDHVEATLSQHAKPLPRRSFFNVQGHLSLIAKHHVGFVAELLSTMMETAIFAYLGVFLFSYRYHWNFLHTFLAVFACCASRAIMIPLLSLAANWVAKVQQARTGCRKKKGRWSVSSTALSTSVPGVVIDKKMQLVLWVSGLRGAMSFALVENIPLYDTVTQQGSRLKPELKAMTSATIVFTVFVLGGYTYYLMQYLGLSPSNKSLSTSETSALVKRSKKSSVDLVPNDIQMEETSERSKIRQRK